MLAEWTIVMVKMPPVDGIKAISPRDVENVERSSCANFGLCQLGGLLLRSMGLHGSIREGSI